MHYVRITFRNLDLGAVFMFMIHLSRRLNYLWQRPQAYNSIYIMSDKLMFNCELAKVIFELYSRQLGILKSSPQFLQ